MKADSIHTRDSGIARIGLLVEFFDEEVRGGQQEWLWNC